MIKKMILASIIGLVPSTLLAVSNSGLYISGKIGTSLVKLNNNEFNFSEQNRYGRQYYSSKLKTDELIAKLSGSLALGYDFSNTFSLPIRTEIDINIRNKISHEYFHQVKNEITLNTFMLNTFYDFKNQTKFTPYLSAGIGIANLTHKTKTPFITFDEKPITESERSNTRIWNLGFGGRYATTDNLFFDISYRYFNIGSTGLRQWLGPATMSSHVDIMAHDLMAGLNYHF